MSSVQLYLDVKHHWCSRLLKGEKSVELRDYPLPAQHVGQPVVLLSTPIGQEGVAVLGDAVTGQDEDVRLAGEVVFSEVITYTSYEQWAADERRHCVPPGTAYSWHPGKTEALYGWVIAQVRAYQPSRPHPRLRRLHRSLYVEVQGDQDQAPAAAR